MTLSPQRVFSLYEKYFGDMQTYKPAWEEIATYIVPNKRGIIAPPVPGRTAKEIYDSTAQHANEVLAASMNSVLTNEFMRWFNLIIKDNSLNEDHDVRQWLDSVADTLFLSFVQSNLYKELAEVYMDLGSFGMGALFFEDGAGDGRESDFLFTALPIGSYAIDEDADGSVNTLFREFRLSAATAVQKWGNNLSEKILSVVEDKPNQTFNFIHAVFPDRKNRERPYHSIYLEKETKHLILVNNYYEFPFMVSRWSKASGEKYGKGPGHIALPNTKTLNKIRELSLKLLGLNLEPPILAPDDGILGKFIWKPRQINYVRGDTNQVRFFTPQTNINYETLNVNALQQAIQDIFFFSQLQLQQGPPMTATEVERRYELMNRVLGPTLGRIKAELLRPLVGRGYAIAQRGGALPPFPYEVEGVELDVEYIGPLVRAQKSSDVLAIQRFFELGAGVIQYQPEALDLMDPDSTLRYIAQVTGVPMKIFRSEQALALFREMKARQQEEVKMMQDASQVAEIAKTAAPLAKVAA